MLRWNGLGAAAGIAILCDWPSTFCIPQGMPAMMDLFDPMEIVITPETTYILISHINDSYAESIPTVVIGRRPTGSSGPMRAIRSDAGSTRLEAAAPTPSRSRRAISEARAASKRAGCRPTATIEESSRSAFISIHRIQT